MSTLKTQFWVGRFVNENIFHDFFEEVFTDNDDDPISRFAESQNEIWIDHDFMEIGFEEINNSIADRFKNYSYADKWIEPFEKKLNEKDLTNVNVIIMVSYDNDRSQISSPKSHKEEGLQIIFLGEIEYEY
ncbi:MAG: immunity 22 family protein [Bacteroidia bacterium]